MATPPTSCRLSQAAHASPHSEGQSSLDDSYLSMCSVLSEADGECGCGFSPLKSVDGGESSAQRAAVRVLGNYDPQKYGRLVDPLGSPRPAPTPTSSYNLNRSVSVCRIPTPLAPSTGSCRSVVRAADARTRGPRFKSRPGHQLKSSALGSRLSLTPVHTPDGTLRGMRSTRGGAGGDLAGAKFGTAKCGTAKLYHILPWYLRTEATFLPLPDLCTFSLHYTELLETSCFQFEPCFTGELQGKQTAEL